MPRKAREKSPSNIYHVILRGINRQSIFCDALDNKKYLQLLNHYKEVSGYELYGYCLMSNHIHLLLKVCEEELEQIFKRIGTSYVYWYNLKYDRCGPLYQDRFKSEVVENERYFTAVLRYIHQNPIMAQVCGSLEYEWSSYNDYINKKGITDYQFAYDIIGEENFIKLMNEKVVDECMEFEGRRKRITDEELSRRIEETLNIKAMMIQNEPKEKREELLRNILQFEGSTTRQLSRLTGISTNIIWNL